jgi:capsular polysaccharide transport system ATP-binding protein
VILFEDVFKYYKTERHRKVVLNRISLALDTGKSYGLLGKNGAGKSTFLKLVSGTELPNSGRIRRNARLSWPLGFAGGFHPKMTGRENIQFIARIYGANIRHVIDFVADFAELGSYIDAPVRTYSSGMQARLAFGLSMAIEFDCYLVDEITAVGDARFQARCERAFSERRKTCGMIMISHSMGTIKAYCDHGMILNDGEIQSFENVDDAIETYRKMVVN